MPIMKFGYKTEGTLAVGDTDMYRRYHETLDQIRAAEAAGFDSVGVSDQHFNSPMATIPQPNLFLACAARVTERVAIRTHTNTMTLRQPIDIAESLATIDIFSHGRLEIGSGRGNNRTAFAAFGVDPDTTFERYKETIQIIVGAWTSEEFEFEGEFFKIPKVNVTPKPVQKPIPPIWYAAIAPSSHTAAGEMGLGLFTGSDGRPIEKMAERIDRYHKAIADPRPIANYPVNHSVTFMIGGYCDVTNSRAREVAERPFIDWIEDATKMYEQAVTATRGDVDFTKAKERYRYEILNENLHFISGDPDYWIEQLEVLRSLGIDEVDMNFHGIDHANIMKSMEMLGKYVFPHFRTSAVRNAPQVVDKQ